MTATPKDILAYLRQREADYVDLLRRVVETESPSLDKPTTDKLVDFLADQLTALGC